MSLHVLVLPSWYAENNADTKGSFFRSQGVALAESGARVGLLYPHIRYTASVRDVLGHRGDVECFQDEGVTVCRQLHRHAVRGSALKHARRLRAYGMALFERYMAANGLPDVIHVHSVLYAGVIALEIHKKYGVPYVLTEHATAYFRGKVRPNKMKLATEVINNAAAHSVVSSAFARLMANFFPKVHWQVLPNVVDETFLNAPLVTQASSEFNFLSVCYFSSRKGLDTVVSAFASVVGQHPNARLTLGGDGEIRPALEQQVAQLGISDKVRFTGLLSRENVLGEMQQSQCFVLGSHYETFGVVLIEALALGKPVIATRCEGPEDIVDDRNGLLVPVGDDRAMAAAMAQMMNEYNHYSGAELRQQCRARFGPAAIAAQLRGMYSQVL